MNSTFWTWVFRVKAVWNCTVSVVFLFADDAIREWLGAPKADPAYRAMFLALAFTFGLGYWRVSQDLSDNRDIVRGGVIGQCSVFAVVAWEVWGAGRLPAAFLVTGLVDLLFAELFVAFLVRTAKPRVGVG